MRLSQLPQEWSTAAAAAALFLSGLLGALFLRRKLQADPLKDLPKETVIAQENTRGALGLLKEMGKRPNVFTTMLELLGNNGSPSACNLFDQIGYFIGSPSQTRQILSSPHCVNKNKVYDGFNTFAGKFNLVTLNYAAWKPLRRTLSPIFHLSNLRLFFQQAVSATKEMIEKIERHNAAKERFFEECEKEGKIFRRTTRRFFLDADHLAILLTLDVITRAMFSQDFGIQRKDGEGGLLDKMLRCTEYYSKQVFNPFYSILHPFEYWQQVSDVSSIHRVFLSMVKERKQENQARKEPKERKDLLDLMLEATDPETGEHLTDEQLSHQCFIFYFAGHDTTAHTIAWAFWEISKHPEVERTIHQEIRDVVQDPAPTFEEIGRLSYITWVIKETLRMHPPVTNIARVADEEVEVDGLKIPKDATFSISITAHHFNDEIWGDPELFRPERFSPENSEGRDPLCLDPLFSRGKELHWNELCHAGNQNRSNYDLQQVPPSPFCLRHSLQYGSAHKHSRRRGQHCFRSSQSVTMIIPLIKKKRKKEKDRPHSSPVRQTCNFWFSQVEWSHLLSDYVLESIIPRKQDPSGE